MDQNDIILDVDVGANDMSAEKAVIEQLKMKMKDEKHGGKKAEGMEEHLVELDKCVEPIAR